MPHPSITFDRVNVAYAAPDGEAASEISALEDLSLEVAAGEPVAIIGPSGCGKSTALHLAAGLSQPQSGVVTVGGEHVSAPRRTTAFIPQNLGLFAWKTVYQNAALGLRSRRISKAEEQRRTHAALEEVGLADFARFYPRDLSGGMRQRLALARAIALDMDVLLMDEPLSAIDALSREELQGALLALWRRRGQTQVLVTHSIEEAVFLGRRIFVLTPRPGRLAGVIDNPHMEEKGWRDSAAFSAQCATVRALLARGVEKAMRL